MTEKTDRPKLELKGENLAHTNRALRTIKMAQPIHAECQFPPRLRWWDKCMEKGHDPYITDEEVPVQKKIYEKDEDGDTYLKEVRETTKIVPHLNTTQVSTDAGINDGKGPELFKMTKGFKELSELGYEPLCEMYDCWLKATIGTVYGAYCSKEHARLVGANEEGIFLIVNDGKKRRAQLRGIELGVD